MFQTLLLMMALPAFASDGSLFLSPAAVALRGEVGQSTTQTLVLTNGTSRAFSFDLKAKDVVIRDGRRVFVDAGQTAGSIAATAVFSPKQVHVAPGESVRVSATVTLSPGTESRAVVLLFSGTNRIMSGNVPILASLGTLLTFTLSDDVAMDATPLSIRPQTPSTTFAVSESCTNTGREPFVAKGMMAILDGRGRLVGKTAISPHRLLPGESAPLGAEYAGELRQGHYRVLVTYEYEGHSLTRSAEVDVP